MPRTRVLAITMAVAASALLSAGASAQDAAPQPPVRLHGVIAHVDADSVTVKDRSGEVVTLVRPTDMRVTEVLPLKLSDIKPHSFIGAGATPQADGTQRAVEVHVFPEAMRGTGEGFHAWDTVPNGTMTNATVATLAAAPASTPGGQKIVLKYKDGEQTLIVPRGTPIVTFKPAQDDQAALMVQGAQVVVTARVKDGKPTASSVLVGRHGFTPPM